MSAKQVSLSMGTAEEPATMQGDPRSQRAISNTLHKQVPLSRGTAEELATMQGDPRSQGPFCDTLARRLARPPSREDL